MKTYEGGVDLSGCGNYARYNEIYDAPHLAVQVTGNDQTVEYNDIHDVVKTSNDSGAIYSYGQNSYLGFNISRNYWHDIKSDKEAGAGVMAIYMDDFIGGATINENIINNVVNTGIYLKGKNTTAKYNIIKDTSRALFLSDFDMRYSYYVDDPRADQRVPTMDQENNRNGFYSDLWNNHYSFWPVLHDLNADGYGGTAPTGNEVVDNVLINGRADVESYFSRLSTVMNQTMTSSSVGFVDAANGNFQLKADAGVFQLIPDFPMNDFSKIGRHEDMYTQDLVKASHESGSYDAPINVELTAGDGYTIYYTFDGTTPSGYSGQIYDGRKITIDCDSILRVSASKDGIYGPVFEYTYEIGNTDAMDVRIEDIYLEDGKGNIFYQIPQEGSFIASVRLGKYTPVVPKAKLMLATLDENGTVIGIFDWDFKFEQNWTGHTFGTNFVSTPERPVKEIRAMVCTDYLTLEPIARCRTHR